MRRSVSRGRVSGATDANSATPFFPDFGKTDQWMGIEILTRAVERGAPMPPSGPVSVLKGSLQGTEGRSGRCLKYIARTLAVAHRGH